MRGAGGGFPDPMKLNARWLRQFMDYDPRPIFEGIRVPVLVLIGDRDVQVPPSDARITSFGQTRSRKAREPIGPRSGSLSAAPYWTRSAPGWTDRPVVRRPAIPPTHTRRMTNAVGGAFVGLLGLGHSQKRLRADPRSTFAS